MERKRGCDEEVWDSKQNFQNYTEKGIDEKKHIIYKLRKMIIKNKKIFK